MRVERLHELAIELGADLKTSNMPTLISSLAVALQNQVKTPNPNFQAEITSLRQKIEEATSKSVTNNYSPSRISELAELKLDKFFGNSLAAWLKEIFERNQITFDIAQKEVAFIQDRLAQIQNSLKNLVGSLKFLGFGTEKLKPNEYEIAILIPRRAVDNDLGEFGRELNRLDRIFGTFCEVVTGSREHFRIRAIASSELSVFLDSIPAVAAFVALAIERAVKLYETILNIRRLRQQLVIGETPQHITDELQKYIEEKIKEGMQDQAAAIENEYFAKIEKNRQNELRKMLVDALDEIAARIDEGYGFDVRGEPEPEPKDSAAENDQSKLERRERDRIYEIVAAARQQIKLFKPEGDPVLRISRQRRDEQSAPSS